MEIVNAQHSPYHLCAHWEIYYDELGLDEGCVPQLYHKVGDVQELLYEGSEFESYYGPGRRKFRYIINPFAPDSIIVVYDADNWYRGRYTLRKFKLFSHRPSTDDDIEFRDDEPEFNQVDAAFLDEESFIYFVCTSEKCIFHYVRNNCVLKKTELETHPVRLFTLERDVFLIEESEKSTVVRSGKLDSYSVKNSLDYVVQYHLNKLYRLLYPLTNGIFNEVLTVLIERFPTNSNNNTGVLNLYPK